MDIKKLFSSVPERIVYLAAGIAIGIFIVVLNPSQVEVSTASLTLKVKSKTEIVDKTKIVTRETSTRTPDGTVSTTRDIVETRDTVTKATQSVDVSEKLVTKVPVTKQFMHELSLYAGLKGTSIQIEEAAYTFWLFDRVGNSIIVDRSGAIRSGISVRF